MKAWRKRCEECHPHATTNAPVGWSLKDTYSTDDDVDYLPTTLRLLRYLTFSLASISYLQYLHHDLMTGLISLLSTYNSNPYGMAQACECTHVHNISCTKHTASTCSIRDIDKFTFQL